MPGEAYDVPTYDVWRVDAFTIHALSGNPAAIVMDAETLDAAAMLRIAREFNLSETAFVLPSSRADFRVRYFTPLLEMPLAGHPTIATAHALRECGRISSAAETVSFEMPAGVIPVAIAADGAHVRYTMTQLEAQFLQTYPPELIARPLGLKATDLSSRPQTVSTGAPFLMVSLGSEGAVARAAPDHAALFKKPCDYLGVHVFARAQNGPHAFVARNFSPPGEILEDPATGSACGAMAAYVRRYHLVETHVYTVSQGSHVGRPGTVYVEAGGGPCARSPVRIGGHAVTIARGRLQVPITGL